MINSCAAILIAAKHGELTKVRDASGITYTVGTLRCNFDFRTSDWDYTTRKAIFCKGNVATNPAIEDKAIGVYLDKNNECAVPPEVLLPDEKYFSVGVWGATKEGLRIVSEWLVFKIKDGCYVDSVESIPPTPTVYEQIVAELSSKSPIDHNHDDKYYSQEYIDNKFENILSELDVYTEFQEDIQESLTEAKAYTDEKMSEVNEQLTNLEGFCGSNSAMASDALSTANTAIDNANEAMTAAVGAHTEIASLYSITTDLNVTVNELKESSVVVDQSYDQSSENAQSGKAVNEAITGIKSQIEYNVDLGYEEVNGRIGNLEGWIAETTNLANASMETANMANEKVTELEQSIGDIHVGAALYDLDNRLSNQESTLGDIGGTVIELDKSVGDIDKALDDIIELQESFMLESAEEVGF